MFEHLQRIVADKYRLESQLGSGGMGIVYAATHRLTHARVAVKFLRDELLDDEGAKRRFIREAQAVTSLYHPNVVRVLDLDAASDDGMYMVLELLSGESLLELLTRVGSLSPSQSCELLLPIMHALASAHELGIIHRDVKPANIFVHREPGGKVVPKLLDFGLARMMPPKHVALTTSGRIMGTPDHMSPEQAFGSRELGPASDVWSMGVVLYRCLTGIAPFARANMESTLLAVAGGDYAPLDARRPDLPHAGELQHVMSRALCVGLDQRIGDMRSLSAAFAAAAQVEATAILHSHGLSWSPPETADRSPSNANTLAFARTQASESQQPDAPAIAEPIAPARSETESSRRRPMLRVWLLAVGAALLTAAAWRWLQPTDAVSAPAIYINQPRPQPPDTRAAAGVSERAETAPQIRPRIEQSSRPEPAGAGSPPRPTRRPRAAELELGEILVR